VLQAVENKNIIASDEFLNTLLETIKEGVLNCKIVCKDGKRSTDRSWRPAWAVLKKSGALFLCKEKKDNIMIPSVDSYPINLKNATIDIAYDYTKRKNVFKVNTFSNSEYLFQTIDYESMIEWIRAMQENAIPPELDKLMSASAAKATASSTNNNSNTKTVNTSSIGNRHSSVESTLDEQDYVHGGSIRSFGKQLTATQANNNVSSSSLNRQQQQQEQQYAYGPTNFYNSGNNSNTKSINNEHANNTSSTNANNATFSDMMSLSSPDELSSQNSGGANTFTNATATALSPNQSRKLEDSSPRRDNNQRKWMRQMTRRIRDFMTNTNNDESQPPMNAQITHANSNTSAQNESIMQQNVEVNRNFGVSLDKCESSTVSPYVPVVVELCTRIIELHICDEGIYRKVGQKQVVNSLRAQLNRGILNIDPTDYNWDNPHAVVSLLKCFLNELPDSLITSCNYI
jgi:hypothetical protein